MPCRPFALLLALLAAPAGASTLATDNCEPLRAQIESRIREAGVRQLSVTVHAMEEAVQGRVVGSCAQGRRKIVYVQHGAAPPRPMPPVLTECRDGSMPTDGRCR